VSECDREASILKKRGNVAPWVAVLPEIKFHIYSLMILR
jgi:hypothetical protein